MNFKLLSASFGAILLSIHTSFGQVTENPKVDESSAPYVKIKKVELTDKNTIIHLQFAEQRPQRPQLRSQPREFPIPDARVPRMMPQEQSQIWLDPETRLYKPGDIEKKFRLIRAENITTTTKMRVSSGDTVNFVAYFERLTPGIEEFDFYEGRSSGGNQSWNFYGIHIKNPLKKEQAAKSVKPAAPAKKPVAKAVDKEPAKPAEPVPVNKDADIAIVKGTVYNAKTKEPVTAQLSYIENGDTLQVRSSSGKYRVGVEVNGKYRFRVQSRGFYGSSFSLAPADSAGKTFDQDIYLTPLIVGETILLPNIYFETSKFTLLPESFEELNRLVDVMLDNPTIGIRVEGHTDNVGDFDKNLELSRQRAEAVKEYLIEKGINASRIEAKGYGGTRPIAKGSEEERKKNRRVEFVITEL